MLLWFLRSLIYFFRTEHGEDTNINDINDNRLLWRCCRGCCVHYRRYHKTNMWRYCSLLDLKLNQTMLFFIFLSSSFSFFFLFLRHVTCGMHCLDKWLYVNLPSLFLVITVTTLSLHPLEGFTYNIEKRRKLVLLSLHIFIYMRTAIRKKDRPFLNNERKCTTFISIVGKYSP